MKEFDNSMIDKEKEEIVENEKRNGEKVSGKIKMKKRKERLNVMI